MGLSRCPRHSGKRVCREARVRARLASKVWSMSRYTTSPRGVMMSRTTRRRRSNVLMSSSLPTVVTSWDFSLSLRMTRSSSSLWASSWPPTRSILNSFFRMKLDERFKHQIAGLKNDVEQPQGPHQRHGRRHGAADGDVLRREFAEDDVQRGDRHETDARPRPSRSPAATGPSAARTTVPKSGKGTARPPSPARGWPASRRVASRKGTSRACPTTRRATPARSSPSSISASNWLPRTLTSENSLATKKPLSSTSTAIIASLRASGPANPTRASPPARPPSANAGDAKIA